MKLAVVLPADFSKGEALVPYQLLARDGINSDTSKHSTRLRDIYNDLTLYQISRCEPRINIKLSFLGIASSALI